MKMDNELNRIVKLILKVSILMFLISLLTKVLGYLFHIMLTKALSTELYGVFALTWMIVLASSSILLLGIPGAVARYIAFYRGKEEDENVGATVITGSLLILPLVIIGVIILFILFKLFPSFFSVKDKSSLIFICILFSAHSFFILLNNILSGFRKPQMATFADIIMQTLKVVFIFFLIIIGINLNRVLSSLFLAIIIPTILAIIYVKSSFKISGRFKLSLIKKLIKFGIPVTLTATIWGVLSWADKFMIKLFLGFEELGIYNVADITAATELIFFMPVIDIFRQL